ncbi:DMT family transporter [Sphingobium sp. AN641]|uniref:DMT family transporter n=1 Tax=Sphingobium sp. AN641 TaxID=3133443 RepID=UPI0030BBB284
MIALAAACLFVLIWSTGFIVARFAVPHASPELVLAIRMTLTAILLGLVAMSQRQTLPRGRRLALHLGAGAMLHGVYLTIGWWTIGQGMPAGIMALLGALQPLIVAVISVALLGDYLPPRGWTGLGIAIAGVGCVVVPVLGRTGSDAVHWLPVAAGIVGIFAMAGGTLIQRGAIAGDAIWVSGAVQNAGGAMVAIIATLIVGDYRWDSSVTLWAALAWSVLGLSAAGLSLLVWLVRHQGPTAMSMLLLLVPPLAAVEAWLLFDERLGPIQLVGFALALGGVLLARSRTRGGTPPVEPA